MDDFFEGEAWWHDPDIFEPELIHEFAPEYVDVFKSALGIEVINRKEKKNLYDFLRFDCKHEIIENYRVEELYYHAFIPKLPRLVSWISTDVNIIHNNNYIGYMEVCLIYSDLPTLTDPMNLALAPHTEFEILEELVKARQDKKHLKHFLHSKQENSYTVALKTTFGFLREVLLEKDIANYKKNPNIQ